MTLVSNAGLNNFNVQPILPIQSDAKNMSIQIHYGSCNHDSPKNKDDHPDIGYTAKKSASKLWQTHAVIPAQAGIHL